MLVTTQTVSLLCDDARARGMKIVMAAGNFDVLHAGHIRHLREARAEGDLLIVQLASDEVVTNGKGPGRPVHPFRERADMIEAIRYVDYVVEDTVHDGIVVVNMIRPDVFTRGCDYTRETAPETALVESYGGRMFFTSGPKRSSRDIVAQIRRT